MKDKIIEKVRKILAKAHDLSGATEHEREVAMKMAHTLLVKHNLSMSDTELQEEKRINGSFERSSGPWHRSIMGSVAELFFCNYFYVQVKGLKDRHVFVGLIDNVETAKEIARFVVDSVAKESLIVKKNQPAPELFAKSFCLGAAASIYARCVQMRKDQEKQSDAENTTGTAMVLASFYEQEKLNNEDYISKNMGIKLRTTSSRKSKITRDGYGVGVSFGETVPLGKQVK